MGSEHTSRRLLTLFGPHKVPSAGWLVNVDMQIERPSCNRVHIIWAQTSCRAYGCSSNDRRAEETLTIGGSSPWKHDVEAGPMARRHCSSRSKITPGNISSNGWIFAGLLFRHFAHPWLDDFEHTRWTTIRWRDQLTQSNRSDYRDCTATTCCWALSRSSVPWLYHH